MVELSLADKQLILEDENIREVGGHTDYRLFSLTKGNDYAMFIGKCYNHARKVGDYKIADKLRVEYNSIKYKKEDQK